MDIKTGLAIYNKPWLIEPNAAVQLLDLWMSGKEDWSVKSESIPKFLTRSKVAIGSGYNLSDPKSFEGAETVIIPISGPLMKNDYCGDLGTASYKALVQLAASTPSVQTIIFDIDSPGGTVDGTKALADAIKSCGKKTIAFVNGMMCSAAYWIGSSCDEIYASSTTDIIGSIGTMCALVDSTAALEKKGYVIREYYATESKDKNKVFSEAEKGNGKALISEILDPMNNEFMGAVKKNRGKKIETEENVLTGKTYMAEQAKEVGLIDGIKSFEQTLDYAFSKQTNTSSNFYSKNKKMTTTELKAAHPDTYNAIFEAGEKSGIEKGVGAEQERVKEWQAWKDIDPESVAKGIDSGKDMSRADYSQFAVKAATSKHIKAAEAENAPEINTAPVPKAKSETDAAIEANTEEVLRAMNIKK